MSKFYLSIFLSFLFGRTSMENLPLKLKIQLQNRICFSLLESMQSSPKHSQQIILPYLR
ncbi:hypothetical protein GLYMA_12G191650v4 [Glycine max]|nr:hypothetical protein GLYMA_12G191650v4 [Glycine max]KAH1143936.1 hypothetical protein GYH30_034251 [Glycine max]